MLTVTDRFRVTLGYIGLRINYATREQAEHWAAYARGYYHLWNSRASDEVLDHYLSKENPWED